MDKVGFTCFPERITPIFKFFNRNQKHMIVGMIAGKKVFWNCSMDVITSKVEYRSFVWHFLIRACQKVLPNLFRLFCFFFFRFSFFSCFCHFAAVANCQLTANCQLPVSSRIFEKASSKREILTKRWRGKFFLRFQIYKPFLYISEAQYHSALGIIAGLVSLHSTGFLLL